jgi:hypothetical protein
MSAQRPAWVDWLTGVTTLTVEWLAERPSAPPLRCRCVCVLRPSFSPTPSPSTPLRSARRRQPSGHPTPRCHGGGGCGWGQSGKEGRSAAACEEEGERTGECALCGCLGLPVRPSLATLQRRASLGCCCWLAEGAARRHNNIEKKHRQAPRREDGERYAATCSSLVRTEWPQACGLEEEPMGSAALPAGAPSFVQRLRVQLFASRHDGRCWGVEARALGASLQRRLEQPMRGENGRLRNRGLSAPAFTLHRLQPVPIQLSTATQPGRLPRVADSGASVPADSSSATLLLLRQVSHACCSSVVSIESLPLQSSIL